MAEIRIFQHPAKCDDDLYETILVKHLMSLTLLLLFAADDILTSIQLSSKALCFDISGML